ncbi:MAG: DHH family phosphoesterase, partial [Lachnospiraceae bacterium]|nr:DHH family phosphoesterase [Lachnospiraceae bacterium]
DGDKIYFYGGKTKQVEKNTRVKARVKAHALRELLETKDNVIIMGHQLSDIDAFGAAIGIYRICKTINKRAYIVLNEVTTSVRPVMERFVGNEEYEEDMFIKNSRAVEIIDDNTAVVVVDVNRPSYVECPEILGIAKAIVILDHHRQSSEIIENASLSYIEPYASSASEMVAEILQYIYDGIKLKQAEADALYGGILIDTQNFTNGTGVRTFEAAAYLKKNGANVTAVRRMFRDDMEDFKARADAIKNTEVYENKYAISVLSAEGLDSPTVVGAQTANELLNIKGINASFVMTEYNGKIYVSARSIDDLNVQLIMERMGGGGHMNTAGAQLDCTMEEAIGLLKRTIDEMIESGDL